MLKVPEEVEVAEEVEGTKMNPSAKIAGKKSSVGSATIKDIQQHIAQKETVMEATMTTKMKNLVLPRPVNQAQAL